MYYARCTPDGAPIYVARTDEERRRQHEILLGRPLRPTPPHAGEQERFCGKGKEKEGEIRLEGAGRTF